MIEFLNEIQLAIKHSEKKAECQDDAVWNQSF